MEKNSIGLKLKNKSGRKKGCIPWNKGLPRTDVEKSNIKKAISGKCKANSGSFKKGLIPKNKGKKMSPEFCKKISEATKGRIPWNKKEPTLCLCGNVLSRHTYIRCGECYRKEMSLKMSLLMKGRVVSEETKQKQRVPHPWSQGDKHRSWRGGVKSVNEKIRKSRLYLRWRDSVFSRDNWTCQNCSKRGNGTLHAHHIKEFNLYPDLRLDINNGITLCLKCHIKIHSKT